MFISISNVDCHVLWRAISVESVVHVGVYKEQECNWWKCCKNLLPVNIIGIDWHSVVCACLNGTSRKNIVVSSYVAFWDTISKCACFHLQFYFSHLFLD